jgi:hypothetical protein
LSICRQEFCTAALWLKRVTGTSTEMVGCIRCGNAVKLTWGIPAHRTVHDKIGGVACWSSTTDDQFWPIFTVASWRMKPGGRPCFERISSQPLLESTTLSFIPGPMLAIIAEFSLGPL